jgi:hypothetical protein
MWIPENKYQRDLWTSMDKYALNGQWGGSWVHHMRPLPIHRPLPLPIEFRVLIAPLVSQVLKEFMDDDVKKLLRKITINSWIK